MVDATTTNYGWTKPGVGSDANIWGGLLNADLDSIDADLFIAAQNALQSPFRNRLINGDINIDQRLAGASLNLTTSFQYGPDRWKAVSGTGVAATFQQSLMGGPAGGTIPVPLTAALPNCLLWTTGTAHTPGSTDKNQIEQDVEGLNCLDFLFGQSAAQAVMLSFWAKASANGVYGGAIQNSAQNRSFVFTYTITTPNTYQLVTVPIVGDITGTWLQTSGIGVRVIFDVGSGSSFEGTAGWSAGNFCRTTACVKVANNTGGTLAITGAQLELGTVATLYERLPPTVALQQCQRRAIRVVNHSLGLTSTSSASTQPALKLPVTMAAVPAYEGTPTFAVGSGSAGTPGLLANTGAHTTVDQACVFNSAANWTSGQFVELTATLSCEL